MQRKSFDIQVEQKDGGAIRAYASTFDREPDAYGDVIAEGAFDKTLGEWRESGKPIPLLWGHDTNDPFSNIGACVDYGTDERGLWYEAEFDPDNEKAQYVRKLAQEGRVYQCSFAFEIVKQGQVTLEDGTKANELKELNLFEISVVQIPANQHATIEEAKGAKVGRRNSKADVEELRAVAEHAAAISEIISGILADEQEPEDIEDEPSAEGEEAEATEGEEVRAAVLEMYKDSI